MNVIVDTNVPIVANRCAPQASVWCVAICSEKLAEIREEHTLVLDDGWHILGEYMHNLCSEGQPGPGDAFLKWVLTNRANPERCELVPITSQDEGFAEFPGDRELADFDPSDRKFVAVAIAHPEHPHIQNATDSDWWHYREVLEGHGVSVDFVCPDYDFKDL